MAIKNHETMETITTILLNFTWVLFLICIATCLIYMVLQLAQNMKSKRLLDNEIYDTMKSYANRFSKLSDDIDKLGNKVRDLEKRNH